MKNGAVEFILRLAVFVIFILWLGSEAHDFATGLTAPIKTLLAAK